MVRTAYPTWVLLGYRTFMATRQSFAKMRIAGIEPFGKRNPGEHAQTRYAASFNFAQDRLHRGYTLLFA